MKIVAAAVVVAIVAAAILTHDQCDPTFGNKPIKEEQSQAMARIGAFTVGWRTDTGRLREHNEDSLMLPQHTPQVVERGYLFAVADGMGGYGGGRDASKTALAALYQHFYAIQPTTTSSEEVFSQAIQYANLEVRRLSLDPHHDPRMGTTLVAALFLDTSVLVAHIGDSRAYLVQQGVIRQITQDHSRLQEQVNAGLLTPEQASRYEGKNIITRAVGKEQPAPVDYTPVYDLQRGDILILCSDGLSNLVSDQELAAVVSQMHPEHAVEYFVQTANERGGIDNITVEVIRIEQVPFRGEGSDDFIQSAHRPDAPIAAMPAAPGSRWLLITLLFVLILIGVVLIAVWQLGLRSF
ncbi:serine/threonine-protein phosphatase [bacterium]|nr:serine/threonine-protein phosphatase [bacterium]